MGNKKPHPTVQVTVKLSPKVAEKLYKVINEEFEGNISEALREDLLRHTSRFLEGVATALNLSPLVGRGFLLVGSLLPCV